MNTICIWIVSTWSGASEFWLAIRPSKFTNALNKFNMLLTKWASENGANKSHFSICPKHEGTIHSNNSSNHSTCSSLNETLGRDSRKDTYKNVHKCKFVYKMIVWIFFREFKFKKMNFKYRFHETATNELHCETQSLNFFYSPNH